METTPAGTADAADAAPGADALSPIGGHGRALGLDLGERRIGIARSDSDRHVAIAHSVLLRGANPNEDHAAIARLVEELDATLVVVGLPLSLSGAIGPAASAVLAEVELLRERLPVPVVTNDERLTTVEATRLHRAPQFLADAGRRKGRGGRAGPMRRGADRPRRSVVVDDAAAALILQAWIDKTATSPR